MIVSVLLLVFCPCVLMWMDIEKELERDSKCERERVGDIVSEE